MIILYSYNKRGREAEYWAREIAGASGPEHRFIPFNHDPYLDPSLYPRAQALDDLYYRRYPGLEALYRDVRGLLASERADALMVDACNPYHPEFLRGLSVYKVLRIADGPISAYDRDFAYLHAFDHILYHSPAYSRDLDMKEKLAYCGAKRADLWIHALFDAMHDPARTEETILARERDIDVVFVGAMHVGKMPVFARIMKALRGRIVVRGLTTLKKNVYFNLRYGAPGWLRALPADRYVPLYQRSKIGLNIHNRGDYTVGSYRLFDLPGNGVMQISDGGRFLPTFFEPGKEIVGYSGVDEMIDLVRYYLAHDDERRQIALNGYRRVMRDHRIGQRLVQAAELIRQATAGRGGGRA